MKNIIFTLVIIIGALISCQESYIGFNSLNQDEQIITETILTGAFTGYDKEE